MKILYLESVAGIAGDMFGAACIDAELVSAEEIRGVPEMLRLRDVEVRIEPVTRATMRATHLEVVAHSDAWKELFPGHAHSHSHGHSHAHGHGHSHDHHHHHHPRAGDHWHVHYADLDRLLEGCSLPDAARAFARKVFSLIAEAEAAAHGMPVDKVAFHEVGAVDSIVDVAMAGFCIAKLGRFGAVASPVKLGRGTIDIEHGTHAVPPPASARLSRGFPVASVPSAITRENVELSTPTGLGILRALDPSFHDGWPAGTVEAQGMGAGTMDLGHYPNVFRVVLLEAGEEAASGLPYETDVVVELCCNVDDETAERTAWAAEQMMEMGALDVWQTPVTGKKGRAAVCLSVLVEDRASWRFADWLLRNTSTFGVRYRSWDRLKLAREIVTRQEDGRSVRYKVGRTTSGAFVKEKPEYEDVRALWGGDA